MYLILIKLRFSSDKLIFTRTMSEISNGLKSSLGHSLDARALCHALIKIFWSIPFRKKQLVAFSEVGRSVLGTKNFYVYYDLFQIGNETNLFGNEMSYSSIKKSWFHCRFETNHIVNKNFSFPKQIVPFQKQQLVAFSETKRFRTFLSVQFSLQKK